MASYYFSMAPMSRSAGRSATAAAAYRSGERILDERTGDIHDYTKKLGVLSSDIVLPDGAPDWANDRSKLWNAAEKAETKINARVAREIQVALPGELNPEQRHKLAMDFAKAIADKHGVAVDVCLHRPNTVSDKELAANPKMHVEHDADGRRHNGNWHAHMMLTTRKLGPEGFTTKTREFDDLKLGKALLETQRELWATMQNKALALAGHSVTVDHRSFKRQGIEQEPQVRLPMEAFKYERRTGKKSDISLEREVLDRLATAKFIGEQERAAAASVSLIQTAETNLSAALAERAKLQIEGLSNKLDETRQAMQLVAQLKLDEDKRQQEKSRRDDEYIKSITSKFRSPSISSIIPSTSTSSPSVSSPSNQVRRPQDVARKSLGEMIADFKKQEQAKEIAVVPSLKRGRGNDRSR